MWNEKVDNILKYAFSNINYYNNNKSFRDYLKGNEQSYKGFSKIDFLTKEIIREHYDQLLLDETDEINHREKYWIIWSSGTTGVPVKFLRTKEEYIDASLQIKKLRKQWSSEAYNGRFCQFDRIKEPIKYIYRGHMPIELDLSLYELSSERYDIYAAALKEYKPNVLQGYASTLYDFSQYILENNIKLPKINIIENRSEHLSANQKNTIERAFNTNVTNLYGLAELFPVAYSCKCEKLHVCIDNVFIEVVDLNSDKLLENEQVGELVLTSLRSKTMPLIRYRSGDMGLINKKRCSCGDVSPTIELVHGRTKDYITTPNGVLNPVVLRRIFNHFYDNKLMSIAQLQFVQKDIYNFQINIVQSTESNRNEIINELTKLMQECFNYKINIHVEWTKELQRHGKSGKVKTFISEL